MIAGTIVFNNPSGTTEQQHCHNTCGIFDKSTGNSERKNRDGEKFNVHYLPLSNGNVMLAQGADKCYECPHWLKFKASVEGGA